MYTIHATGTAGTTAFVILGLWFLFGAQLVGRIARAGRQKTVARDETLYASLEYLRATGVQDRLGGVPVLIAPDMVWVEVDQP